MPFFSGGIAVKSPLQSAGRRRCVQPVLNSVAFDFAPKVARVNEHAQHAPVAQPANGAFERRNRGFRAGDQCVIPAREITEVEHHRCHHAAPARGENFAEVLVSAQKKRYLLKKIELLQSEADGVKRDLLDIEGNDTPGNADSIGEECGVVTIPRSSIHGKIARHQGLAKGGMGKLCQTCRWHILRDL
jgi:hypothetical protein